MTTIVEIVSQSEFYKKEIWLEEAQFGLVHIKEFCDELSEGASVLEVGCGSGILLAMLSEHYRPVNFEGIEPLRREFSQFSDLNSLMQRKYGIRIHKLGFEDYVTEKKYDLIYLINVFEYFHNWEKFFDFVEKNLSKRGVCVILCPNYGFPYEPHFRIPILVNKKFTGKVFRKFISKFEIDNKSTGLWGNLNFVKLSEVKRVLENSSLALRINHSITNELIDRISSGEEFKKRQRFVGVAGLTIKKFGLSRMLKLKVFENLQPYMMLELRFRENAD